MKHITVRVRDEDYAWLINSAQEILDKFAQAGKPLSFTPEELIRVSLQDRALRTIGQALYTDRKEADTLLSKEGANNGNT